MYLTKMNSPEINITERVPTDDKEKYLVFPITSSFTTGSRSIPHNQRPNGLLTKTVKTIMAQAKKTALKANPKVDQLDRDKKNLYKGKYLEMSLRKKLPKQIDESEFLDGTKDPSHSLFRAKITQKNPLSFQGNEKGKPNINTLFSSKSVKSMLHRKPIRSKKSDRVITTEPRRNSIGKPNPASVQLLKSEFNKFFTILDINSRLQLNYSRFSILLQSMNFIENPYKKNYEERELTLSAWKLLGGETFKAISRVNAYFFCLAVINFYDKSMQSHRFPPGLGRIVDKIFCIRKDEIKKIHSAFYKFSENRRNNLSSESPQNRNILKKNLSFEARPDSGSPLEVPLENISPTTVKDFSKNKNQKYQNEIIEEDTNCFTKLLKHSTLVDRPDFIIEENNSNNQSFITNSRLSLKLTTQVFQKYSKSRHEHRNSNRSLTYAFKNDSFMEIDNSKMKDQEIRDGKRHESQKAKRNYRDFAIKITDNEKDIGKVVVRVKGPSGQEVLVLDKLGFSMEKLEDLIAKYGLSEKQVEMVNRKVEEYLHKR